MSFMYIGITCHVAMLYGYRHGHLVTAYVNMYTLEHYRMSIYDLQILPTTIKASINVFISQVNLLFTC